MKWKIIYFSMVSILLLVLFLEITKNVEKYDNITTISNIKQNGKPYIRTIILIIASNDKPIFENGRKIWKKYMNVNPNIKVFFVYGKLEKPLLDVNTEHDLIYPEIEENYPLLIKKNMEAMKYIQSTYDYTYLIRTNLSTFWDFFNLEKHLSVLPTQNCYSGTFYPTFISGTDIILSKDNVSKLLDNEKLINEQLPDDVAIGNVLKEKLNVDMTNKSDLMYWFPENSDEIVIQENIYKARDNNCSHYRVYTQNREQLDLLIYKNLLKIIYNIDFTE